MDVQRFVRIRIEIIKEGGNRTLGEKVHDGVR